MALINFMTGMPYIAPNHSDIKLAVIRPNGDILLADKSYDGKAIQEFLPDEESHARIEVHTDYCYILCKLFFQHNPILQEIIKKKDLHDINLYGIIVEMVNSGNIFFNNNTTYEGPTFFLHGKHGQLLIPEDVISEEQRNSLLELSPFFSDFREIEVKQYRTKENNSEKNGRLDCIDSMMYDGNNAISEYLKTVGKRK